MNILLSAYACHPYVGSESGIGWNFAKELALKGHRVTIITKNPVKEPLFREEIRKLQLGNNLLVQYYDLPKMFNRFYKAASSSEHIYYYLWQIGLFFFVKNLLKKQKIDLIHHITLGVFRSPSFLHLLDKPFIFGPVGGGEECPLELANTLPVKFRLKEKARTLINNISRLDPFLNQCFRNADLIILKTSDNLKYIPESFHAKCQIFLEVGVKTRPDFKMKAPAKGSFKILYAGRLIYWKGIHLALKSYARLIQTFPDVEFTIVGSGNDEEWIKEVALQEKVYNKINWVPRVEQQTLFEMYRNFDLLLFPSLHDSSGGVVLEALTFGLPVVCLDLGGPKEIVDESCSYIISTKNASEQEVVERITEKLLLMVSQPEKMEIMQQNAMSKAEDYSWEKVVARIYESIEEKVLGFKSVYQS